MSFSKLYQFACTSASYPVLLEGQIDQQVAQLTAQDEICYVPCELDETVSLGHFKQMRISSAVYDNDPKWVSQIRYSNTLNLCWQRYVCCKELMHAFDKQDERVDSAEKLRQLLGELEAPLPGDKASRMYRTETKTMWMALAILCPAPVREKLKPLWDQQEKTDYEIALMLRIPEILIRPLMSERYDEILEALLTED